VLHGRKLPSAMLRSHNHLDGIGGEHCARMCAPVSPAIHNDVEFVATIRSVVPERSGRLSGVLGSGVMTRHAGLPRPEERPGTDERPETEPCQHHGGNPA